MRRIITAREQVEMLSPWRTATDFDEIMDLLGGPIKSWSYDTEPPKADPPIPGVPKGYEKYYKGCQSCEDKYTPHMMMPTRIADYYKEYDRDTEEAQSRALEKVIREHGKIRQPLLISTDGTHAIMHEGNHRLALAKKLGMSHVPIRVSLDKEVKVNEGMPVPMEPFLKDWVTKNRDALPPHSQIWDR